MQQSFRLIHASDFHLERPPRGLSEVPDHLRGLFVDAPYRAAERVFDAAVKERVDFVALSGDLLDPVVTGPRGLVFLDDQFARLAENKIQVYWAGGRSDDFDRWVDAWPVPDNVFRFPLDRVERVIHHRDGQPLVQVLGASSRQRKRIRSADFRLDANPLFAVAIAYGSAEADFLTHHPANYWALGGEHNRRALLSGQTAAHYSGSPQGRRPQESGAHGCTLVNVDENQQVRTSFIPTDAVRFHHERISVVEPSSNEQLYEIMSQRLDELLADPFGPDLLIDWTISPSDMLPTASSGTLANNLIGRLRASRAKRPLAWTIAIQLDAQSVVKGEQLKEDSALGEFLRTVRHYAEHPDDPLDLEPFLAERHVAGRLAAAVAIDSAATRNRVLAEVTRLGLELLSPEEPRA